MYSLQTSSGASNGYSANFGNFAPLPPPQHLAAVAIIAGAVVVGALLLTRRKK